MNDYCYDPYLNEIVRLRPGVPKLKQSARLTIKEERVLLRKIIRKLTTRTELLGRYYISLREIRYEQKAGSRQTQKNGVRAVRAGRRAVAMGSHLHR